jgi:KRAB domain-containing zinc finger protein
MSEIKKIKIELVCDDNNRIESSDHIVDNIKKEKEVQFVLILPPRQVKVEKVETTEVHEQTQSDEKKFQCQQCPKSFEKRQILKNHEQSHKSKVECQICYKKFSKLSLKIHLKNHESIRKFNCDHCSAGFVTKQTLMQHMWKHRSGKQFICSKCSRGFIRIENFKVHLLQHSTNPRPFQCDLCPKSYPTKGKIQDHFMAVHTDQSFKCDQCDYTTKWKTGLYQHKMTHSTAKPFSCQVCKKKFKTNYEVRRHQAVHRTRTKDFECKTCGKMFGSQNYLRQHEQNGHGKNLSFCFKHDFNFPFNFSCRQELHLQQMPENFQNKNSSENTREVTFE